MVRHNLFFTAAFCFFLPLAACFQIIHYQDAQLLKERTTLLDLLFTQTYGPQNPFQTVTATIFATIEVAEMLTAQANKTKHTAVTEIASELECTLPHIDAAVTETLNAFANNTLKEEAIAKLTVQSNVSARLITMEALPFIKKAPALAEFKKKHRFFIINPGILASAGKYFIASAAGIWIIYVLHKIHNYIRLPNTELVRDTQDNQIAVYEKLIQMSDTIKNITEPTKSSVSNIPRHTPNHQATSPFDVMKRLKQWNTQRKVRNALQTDDSALKKLVKPEDTQVVDKWTTAISKLIKVFPSTQDPT